MMGNLFPNLITIGIIAISMLIFSTFTLLAFNLTNFLKIWEDKIEVIAYLKRGTPTSEVEPLLKKTRLLEGVEVVRYVSPYDAMAFMETKLGRQKNLLEGIQPAVLPPSFEIQLKKDYRNSTKMKEVVTQFKKDSAIRGNSIWPGVGGDIFCPRPYPAPHPMDPGRASPHRDRIHHFQHPPVNHFLPSGGDRSHALGGCEPCLYPSPLLCGRTHPRSPRRRIGDSFSLFIASRAFSLHPSLDASVVGKDSCPFFATGDHRLDIIGGNGSWFFW